MQAEPERLVGDHVVVGPVVRRRDDDRLHPEALGSKETLPSGLLVVGAHARRDPQGSVPLDARTEGDHQPSATTAPPVQGVVGRPDDAERPAVGEHQKIVVAGHRSR